MTTTTLCCRQQKKPKGPIATKESESRCTLSNFLLVFVIVTYFLKASSSMNSMSSLNLSLTLLISYSESSRAYCMLKALAAICCLARDEEGESYWIPEPKLVPERERESSSPIINIRIRGVSLRTAEAIGALGILIYLNSLVMIDSISALHPLHKSLMRS
jgi:hypothetical protein